MAKRRLPKKAESEMPHEWALRSVQAIDGLVSDMAQAVLVDDGTFNARDYVAVLDVRDAVAKALRHFQGRVNPSPSLPAEIRQDLPSRP